MPDAFADLLLRVRAGDSEAIRQLVEGYGTVLRAVIRQHLNARLRCTHEPDDLLQSVWKDLFADALAKYDFSTSEQLVAFLSKLCVNKVNQVHRKQLDAQKRDRTLQTPLPDDVPQQQPGPDRLAEAADRWQTLLQKLTPQWQRAMTMLRDGHSRRDVAERLGIAERTLDRLLERLRSDRLSPD